MISSQSIITKFGGERTTGHPAKFDRKSPIKVASTSAEFLQASCEKMSLPMGPRLHEECETKVPRGELADSSSEACQRLSRLLMPMYMAMLISWIMSVQLSWNPNF